MSNAVRIWQISQGDCLQELELSRLNLESRLEDWIEKDISILSSDLMIIGRQVETAYDTYIDLLCIDSRGDLAILELKRDQTPRDTVAQALDYASWARDLSRDAVCSIANDYLRNEGGLEEAFRAAFKAPLPDVLNDSHRIFIVASSMDASTERIVRYLSEAHNVGINVAEFKYYRDAAGTEYLSRVFLVDPDSLDTPAVDPAGKRRRRLSPEDLMDAAVQNGVAEIYEYLDEHCTDVFDMWRTTLTSLAFKGKGFMEWGQKNVIFSLIPTQSSPSEGLKFQVYLSRLACFLNASEAEVTALLPANKHDWSYGATTDPDWTGFEGYFSSLDEARAFVAGITGLKVRQADTGQ
jgi:hypothetical protein